MKVKFATIFTISLIVTSAVGPGAAQDPLDDQLHEVLPRDAIPAISNPEFEPAERADKSMDDEELVIGLVGDSEQRAYSTWQLDRHEIASSYEQYNRDGRMGILGRRLRNRALPGKERIIGVRSTDGTTAFVAKDVRAMKIVEAQVGSLPVVLVAAGKDLPVVAFERRAKGRGYFPSTEIWKKAQ